ncbi:MAG: NTP transferase domain-containing protein [Chloroflexi bacterium]|nr:NTP transferase domain-containing protein [Chloroflexota bacterium]
MQILFPMGGRGTRVRPHTHIRPKPLMTIAGKPILQHIMDYLMPLAPSEFIFVTNPGAHGDQVRDFVSSAYPDVQARYLVQEEARGQAHAVGLAEDLVREPLLIMFIDTLFEADLDVLRNPPGDGAVLTHYVENPERFGVVTSENGCVTAFLEKPSEPVSHDGIVGIYVINQPEKLFRAIRQLMDSGAKRSGEYFLADAAQLMVEEGARLTPVPAAVWQDTGTIEAVLGSGGPPFQAHHYLLDRLSMNECAEDNSAIIPPVYLPASATISESVVGPYVSVGEGAVIRRSVVRESVIGRNALIDGLHLEYSLIGDEATATGKPSALNISDHSSVTE